LRGIVRFLQTMMTSFLLRSQEEGALLLDLISVYHRVVMFFRVNETGQRSNGPVGLRGNRRFSSKEPRALPTRKNKPRTCNAFFRCAHEVRSKTFVVSGRRW